MPRRGQKRSPEPQHAWDVPDKHHWDVDGECLPQYLHESSESEEDLDDPDVAASRLTDLLLSSFFRGLVTAKRVCLIAYWAWKAGARGGCKDLAMGPGKSTGNYSAHTPFKCQGIASTI